MKSFIVLVLYEGISNFFKIYSITYVLMKLVNIIQYGRGMVKWIKTTAPHRGEVDVDMDDRLEEFHKLV